MEQVKAVATLVSALLLVAGVGCGGPPRFVSHGGMTASSAAPLEDPMPLVAQAHSIQATDPHRAFLLLAHACEVSHWVEACIEAEAHDPLAGRPLIVHGCALGSGPACKTLLRSEISHEHKSDVAARADVDHVLEMGCSQGVTTACLTRGDLDAALNGSASAAGTTSVASAPLPTEERRALEACVSACKARRVSCARQCELEGWDTCPPESECNGAERTCETSCEVNPAQTCAVELQGKCGPLG
jgi:hypothetical protein